MKTLHDTYYLSYTTQVLEPEAEEMTSIKCKGCYIVGFGDMKQLEIVLGGSTTGMHIIVAQAGTLEGEGARNSSSKILYRKAVNGNWYLKNTTSSSTTVTMVRLDTHVLADSSLY